MPSSSQPTGPSFWCGCGTPFWRKADTGCLIHGLNSFWGSTYRQAFDAPAMTQGLSILTGCSAGATEAVVVVPFE